MVGDNMEQQQQQYSFKKEMEQESIRIGSGVIISQGNIPNNLQYKEQLRKFKLKSHDQLSSQFVKIRKQFSFVYLYDLLQLKDAFTLHIHNASPYIQTYYQLHYFKDNNRIDLQCEKYRFTLADILQQLDQHQLQNIHPQTIPNQLYYNVMTNMLHAYRYILYLLGSQSHRIHKLQYSITPYNIIITEDYVVKLGYPCMSSRDYEENNPKRGQVSYKLLLVRPQVISMHLRSKLIKLSKKLISYCSAPNQIQQPYFNTEPTVSIVEEAANITKWMQLLKPSQIQQASKLRIMNKQSLYFFKSIQQFIKKPLCQWFNNYDTQLYQKLKQLEIINQHQNINQQIEKTQE